MNSSTDLAQAPGLGPELLLYDINIDSAKRNECFGNEIQEQQRRR
ncbi:hypothetical protein [Haladaptatus halobius]|nr:hypothetical protein [Haladaptatus halobius]